MKILYENNFFLSNIVIDELSYDFVSAYKYGEGGAKNSNLSE